MAEQSCWLPGGYIDEHGVRHREAILRQLSGREEELLATMPGADRAGRISQILARCVERIGTISPVTEAFARGLVVADRQYLLLKLREISFGDRIEGTIACPWPQCGAKADIDFKTSDVPVKHCEEMAASYELVLSSDEIFEDDAGRRHSRITFRLPNGEDQELLGPILNQNPAEALSGLLERSILESDGGWEDIAGFVAQLPPLVRVALENAMQDHAPLVELGMDVTCPECGRAYKAPFELQDFFFGELLTTRDLLYRQVHYLAFHYHWSEQEILEMSRDKRLGYIEILANEIEALNEAYG